MTKDLTTVLAVRSFVFIILFPLNPKRLFTLVQFNSKASEINGCPMVM